MRPRLLRARGPSSALLVLSVALLLPGCALFHHHRNPNACYEPPFTGDTATRAPLKVPEGLSAPDTAGAVKVPALTVAAAPRPKNAPCLDMPPPYGNGPLALPARRPTS